MFAAGARSRPGLSCLIDPTPSPRSTGCAGGSPRPPSSSTTSAGSGRRDDRGGRGRGALRPGRHPQGPGQGRGVYALGKKSPPYLDLAPLIGRSSRPSAPALPWESDCPFQVVRHDSISSSCGEEAPTSQCRRPRQAPPPDGPVDPLLPLVRRSEFRPTTSSALRGYPPPSTAGPRPSPGLSYSLRGRSTPIPPVTMPPPGPKNSRRPKRSRGRREAARSRKL